MANKGGSDELCLGSRAGAGEGRSILRNVALRKASGRGVEGRRSGDKMGHFRTSKLLAVARERSAGMPGVFGEQLEWNLGSVVEALHRMPAGVDQMLG